MWALLYAVCLVQFQVSADEKEKGRRNARRVPAVEVNGLSAAPAISFSLVDDQVNNTADLSMIRRNSIFENFPRRNSGQPTACEKNSYRFVRQVFNAKDADIPQDQNIQNGYGKENAKDSSIYDSDSLAQEISKQRVTDLEGKENNVYQNVGFDDLDIRKSTISFPLPPLYMEKTFWSGKRKLIPSYERLLKLDCFAIEVGKLIDVLS